MELRRYLAILRRRLVFIVVCVAVALTGSYITTPQDTKYVAISTIYVGSRQLQSQNNNPNFNDSLQTVERSITTFALMIDSRPTAAAALELTGIPRSEEGVVGATTTYAIPNTQLILVIVSDPDPAIARDLANGMATAFVSKVQQFEPTAQAAEGTVPSLPAYVFERANLPTVPQGTDLNRNLLVAGVFGAVLAAGIAFLVDYLDITVRGPADAERRLELPVLGAIPIDDLQPDATQRTVIRLARETA